jgi:threonine dehydratase
MSGVDADTLIASLDPQAARAAIADVAVRTPVLPSDQLSERIGGPVVLKAECLQRTGSFKLRGALAKIAALGDKAAAGLVTASAGNHGQAVAYAARARGVRCEVFMPRDAAVSKVASIDLLGGIVRTAGETVDEAILAATEHAEREGAAFVHPFDDPDVIAGQATLGLELVEDVAGLRRIVLPIGGGGLAAGVGIAVKRSRPDVELVGVQAQACAPFAQALGDPGSVGLDAAATIADGIAVKRPGRLTLPLLRKLLDDLWTVDEEQIADAIVLIAEGARLVAEGAGAVGVAALLAGHLEAPGEGTTAVVISGGNIDSGLLGAILRRHETELGRRVRLFTRVADRPGGLAELLSLVAAARANLVTIEHLREAVPLHVRETGVELTLETRGPEHTEEVANALRAAGYDVQLEAGAGGR